MFYSKETNGFYDPRINAEIPADAVPISAEKHALLLAGNAQGKRIGANAKGQPVLFDAVPVPYAHSAAAYLNRIRAVREEVLNRLAGFGFAALQAGDTAGATALASARQALLDMPTCPGAAAAQDIGELVAAVSAEFDGIKAALPAAFQSAFPDLATA